MCITKYNVQGSGERRWCVFGSCVLPSITCRGQGNGTWSGGSSLVGSWLPRRRAGWESRKPLSLGGKHKNRRDQSAKKRRKSCDLD